MGNLLTLVLPLLKRYWEKAAGKKTYLVSVLGIAGALMFYMAGGLNEAAAVSAVMLFVSQITQRHGQATETKKTVEALAVKSSIEATNPLRSASDAIQQHKG